MSDYVNSSFALVKIKNGKKDLKDIIKDIGFEKYIYKQKKVYDIGFYEKYGEISILNKSHKVINVIEDYDDYDIESLKSNNNIEKIYNCKKQTYLYMDLDNLPKNSKEMIEVENLFNEFKEFTEGEFSIKTINWYNGSDMPLFSDEEYKQMEEDKVKQFIKKNELINPEQSLTGISQSLAGISYRN